MVTINFKLVNKNDMDGRLTFRNFDGLIVGCLLGSFPKGVIVDYEGNVTFVGEEDDLEFRTDEININVTSDFPLNNELVIDYTDKGIHICCYEIGGKK